MRGGMAEDVEGVWIFFGEDLEFYVAVERAAEIDEFAVTIVGLSDAGDEGGIQQARRNTFGDVGRSCAAGDIFDAAVGQCDLNLIHAVLTRKENTKLIGGSESGQGGAGGLDHFYVGKVAEMGV